MASILILRGRSYGMPWGVLLGVWPSHGLYLEIFIVDDRIGGNAVTPQEMADFRACVEECELLEMPTNGYLYSWSNRHESGSRMDSKIGFWWIIHGCCTGRMWELYTILRSDHSPIFLQFKQSIWAYSSQSPLGKTATRESAGCFASGPLQYGVADAGKSAE